MTSSLHECQNLSARVRKNRVGEFKAGKWMYLFHGTRCDSEKDDHDQLYVSSHPHLQLCVPAWGPGSHHRWHKYWKKSQGRNVIMMFLCISIHPLCNSVGCSNQFCFYNLPFFSLLFTLQIEPSIWFCPPFLNTWAHLTCKMFLYRTAWTS